MKKILNIKMLALFLAYSFVAVADLDASSEHNLQTKYISYSQIGNPADVLEVKTKASFFFYNGECMFLDDAKTTGKCISYKKRLHFYRICLHTVDGKN